MRIAVMGTGGVGGYFGARLAAAGNDVTFIARGAHLAALREHGLRIESGTSPLHLADVQATDNPQAVAPVDIVMFCVKLWDVGRRRRRSSRWSHGRRGDSLPERARRAGGARARARPGARAWRRRVYRRDDPRTGRDRAHRHDGAAARRRLSRRTRRARDAICRCLSRGRYRHRGLDRRAPRALGKILLSVRAVGMHVHRATTGRRHPRRSRPSRDIRSRGSRGVERGPRAGRAARRRLRRGAVESARRLPAEMRSSMQNDLAAGAGSKRHGFRRRRALAKDAVSRRRSAAFCMLR